MSSCLTHSVASALKTLVTSRLIRRITLAVFLCILTIEVILLVTSTLSERKRLLSQIDDAVDITASVLLRGTLAKVAVQGMIDDPVLRYPLAGLIVQWPDGRSLNVGDTAGLETGLASADSARRYDSLHQRYERTVSGLLDDRGQPLTLLVRMNARNVDSQLTQYAVKLIALIMLVSLFVTIAMVVVLEPLLIRPLLRLQRLLSSTRDNGLGSTAPAPRHLARRDELGDAFRAFERLRQHLVDTACRDHEIRQRFQDLADLGADCFWEVDSRLRFTFINGSVQSLFGIDAGHALGKHPMSTDESGNNLWHLPDGLLRTIADNGQWEGQLLPQREDTSEGHLHTVRITARALRDTRGRFAGARGIVADVTQASELSEKLHYQASHDELTGLANRRAFELRLDEKIALFRSLAETGRQTPFCVCMLDLDRFKIINDTCGHEAGDRLLRQVAEMMQEHLRDGDMAARVGGDEFAILLPRCQASDALKVAERIRHSIERFRFPWEGEAFDIGVSIGVVEATKGTACSADVLRNADAGCYKAKHGGRNQVQLYSASDESTQQHQHEMQWASNITQAIDENRLLLFQQSIVPMLEAGEAQADVAGTPAADQPNYVHVELLLRMQSRDGSVVSPGAFLPAAERFKLMGRVDRWVVHAALSWLATQQVPGDVTLMLSINLSGDSLTDAGFQQFLSQRIESFGVNPRHLCFEVTETAAIQNFAIASRMLQQLRELGCHIALDDFGSGFSSLGYLRQLPVDYIKLDGSFSTQIVDNPLDRALVRCMVEIGSIIGARTVAEYVDAHAKRETLAELGVELAQGYLFSEPTPLSDVAALVAQMHPLRKAA